MLMAKSPVITKEMRAAGPAKYIMLPAITNIPAPIMLPKPIAVASIKVNFPFHV